MSDIKLGNADEVIEQLERERLSNPDRNKTHTVLAEPNYTGEIDMDTVRKSMKNNAEFIVGHWHSQNSSSEEAE